MGFSKTTGTLCTAHFCKSLTAAFMVAFPTRTFAASFGGNPGRPQRCWGVRGGPPGDLGCPRRATDHEEQGGANTKAQMTPEEIHPSSRESTCGSVRSIPCLSSSCTVRHPRRRAAAATRPQPAKASTNITGGAPPPRSARRSICRSCVTAGTVGPPHVIPPLDESMSPDSRFS